MTVFSPQEMTRIEASIAEVERSTAAEIVVVTRKVSDSYADVRLFAAGVSALSAAAASHFVWPELSVASVLSLQLIVGLAVWLLSRLRVVLRVLVPVERRQLAVERACELEFLEHAVFETRDRNGVLIFLSELERRVAILGDKGIHARVETSGWDELVKHIVDSIHRGRACDGVCEVIARLGATLSRDAPIRADDTNELDNRVRQR